MKPDSKTGRMWHPVGRCQGPVLTLLLAAILVGGCGQGTPEPAAELEALPVPAHLDQVDPPVREQYEARRRHLEGLLAEDTPSAEAFGQAYGDLGMWHHAYGDQELARLAYSHALAWAPETQRWRYYLGLVLGAQGETADARVELETFLRHRPDDVPARVHLAEIELDAGRPEAAKTLLDEAVARAPDNPRALAGLGRTALQQRDFAAAVEHLAAALELQPDKAKVHYSLGLAYRGLGDRGLAARHMTQGQRDNRDKGDATMVDPLMAEVRALDRGARALGQRGRRAFVDGDFARAIAAARQAVAANPEQVQPRLNLGAALLRAGRAEDAVGELEEVLRRSPGHPIGHFNLGATYYQLGRWGQASEQYQAAVAANPGFKEAHFNLANLSRFQGDFATALPSYQRVVELDPGLDLARLWQVVCLHDLGRVAEARQTLARDLEALRDSRRLGLLEARFLANAADPGLRDPARALHLARTLHHAQPTLASAEAIAAAHASSQDFELAVAWQGAALETVRERADGKTLARVAERLDRYRRGQGDDAIWSVDEHRGADLAVAGPSPR